VADEYFAVTEKAEALYGQPRELPDDDEGHEMRKLRTEMRVNHCHGKGFVFEQSGDGIEAHAAIHGLGGQGVPQLVGGDAADPGGIGQCRRASVTRR
jgi:hypothetical protein